MCGVWYERLPGRLWACYSCQLMSDTLLIDLSLHIHDSTLCQDILRCTNLGSLTEKRPRKVGHMLFAAGNSSVTPCVCIVYIVCPLCMYFSLVSAMCIFLLYITRWKVVSMAQSSHSKPLTLGAAHAARLCSEDALLDGASTSCSHCTCLYSVASSRGTHDGMSRFVWAITIAPNIYRACVALSTLMCWPMNRALQLWLLHTLVCQNRFLGQ